MMVGPGHFQLQRTDETAHAAGQLSAPEQCQTGSGRARFGRHLKIQRFRPVIHGNQMEKTGIAQAQGRDGSSRKPRMGGDQYPHGLHRRKDRASGEVVVAQPGTHGIADRQHAPYRGKPCQRARVRSSISTGRPRLFTAQWRV